MFLFLGNLKQTLFYNTYFIQTLYKKTVPKTVVSNSNRMSKTSFQNQFDPIGRQKLFI